MSYGWIITFDNFGRGKTYSVKGTVGPGAISPEHEIALKVEKGEAFRMFDDDNNLCFIGKIIGDYSGFEPLDDFGTPNSGCTGIQYRGKYGEWLWL